MPPGETAQMLIDLIVEEGSGFDDLGRRIVANRIIGVLSGWLPAKEKEQIATCIPPPMTRGEANQFSMMRMEFGKWQGKLIAEIPIDYLEWLADRSRELWKKLHGYLNTPDLKRDREDDDDA